MSEKRSLEILEANSMIERKKVLITLNIVKARKLKRKILEHFGK